MSRYGTTEVFHSPLKEQTPETCFWNKEDNEPVGEGWFYWCCFVGCLPEGEPIGPFKSEEEAVLDAIEHDYIDDMEELTESELDNRYHESLSEVYGTVNICGLEYDSANALKEVDPTAYRCGFSDWLDSEMSDDRIIEVGSKYFLKS